MKILIAGDSWGCGEWGWDADSNPCVTHAGIERFLIEDGHQVNNVSAGGISNSDAITKLQDALLEEPFDLIFWFQTDPLRDARPYTFFKQKILTFDSLITLQQELLFSSYIRLNNLSNKIYCIGGCSPLSTEYLSHFSNLIPLVPSVIKLLVPNTEPPIIWFSEWLSQVNRQFDEVSLDRMIFERQKQRALRDNYPELFYPDGHHPNRLGIEILYKYITNELEFL